MKVVIVGAGIAGLSIGWRLLQAGADVVVLERAQPARGATWAAAGMISAAGDDEDVNPAKAALARRSATRWPNFAREIEEQCGRAVGFRKDGNLIIATNQQEQSRLETRAAIATDLSLLSAAEACALEPLLRADIAGALWDPSEAQVDNRALGAALLEIYLRAGGALQANETVVRFETDGGRIFGARTPFGLYEGDAYVLAAGAWTSRIEGLPAEALPPVVPVKGEMIALHGGALPTHIISGEDVYIVPRAGRLLVGATLCREGFDTSLTDAARTWLCARAVSLMPSLADWDIVEHWAGLRPGSPDNLPILGRTMLEGLFVASGQFRNGILFAPVVAEVVSALVQEKSAPIDIAAFDPRRFGDAALVGTKEVPTA